MKTILLNLKKLFIKNEEADSSPVNGIPQEILIKLHNNASEYYNKENLVYLNQINAYGAFKYATVKDILFSEKFGVSPMHTILNRIYFQTDPKKHSQNKRAALKHLEFLSKQLQFVNSEYVHFLVQLVFENLLQNKTFNLIDYLINPVITMNALNDLDFLEVLPVFNPNDKNFSFDLMIKQTKEIFENRSNMEQMLRDNLRSDNIPPLMNKMLNDMSVEGGFNQNDLPHFFTTVIYTSIENVASFTGTFIYYMLKRYPDLIKNNEIEKCMDIADELLRIYSPNFITFRTALEDMSYQNIHLKKGDLIALFIGTANKDPNTYNNPLEIIPNRLEKHLAFGRGRISCIGQFASFRIALGILKNIHQQKGIIKILDEEPSIEVKGVVRLSGINATYSAG